MDKKLARMLKEEGLIVPLVNELVLTTDIQVYTKSDIKIWIELLNALAEKDDRKEHFHASAAIACMREQSISLTKDKSNKPDVGAKWIFADGDLRNIHWIVIFNKLGVLKEYEKTRHSKKYDMKWTPDAILDLSEHYPDLEGSDRVGVEIKGMHNFEWYKFKAGTAESKWAIARYYQVHAYMLASGAKFWVVWGQNKNTQQYTEQIIKRDPQTIKYLQDRYRYMLKARSKPLLPAVECDMNNKDPKYRYCSQATNCEKLINKKARKMKPMSRRASRERAIDRIIKEVLVK